ncbi:hypothetical protein [Staphylococcus aureus]
MPTTFGGEPIIATYPSAYYYSIL